MSDVAVAVFFFSKRGDLGEEEEENEEEAEAEVVRAHPCEGEGKSERDHLRDLDRQRRRRDDKKCWAAIQLVLVVLLAVAQAPVERRCMALPVVVGGWGG